MSKVDGSFKYNPVGVNFLTECAKVLFAIVMLVIQVHLAFFLTSTSKYYLFCFHVFLEGNVSHIMQCGLCISKARRQKVGEKPLLSISTFVQENLYSLALYADKDTCWIAAQLIDTAALQESIAVFFSLSHDEEIMPKEC
ncbi:unnamed protein product [Ilex paraguariensis]|uniref:Uncharacterized protein n=1 Tax=Ilex paraguariensis TaxID=185542 RepID=A0ABC8TP96_9AQUA